ncbi:MAG: TIGR00730 family Rossman fold protein [Bacteroidetes bacterium]|nr:TIGR00730 family Rossman fold protein [Bacteroidota bacterium]
MKISAITIFCGSRSGHQADFETQATVLGKLLAQKEVTLIYGGGNKGMMGAVANACLLNGGKVIGIIPKLLLEWEAQHEGLTELIVTESMHERKKILYEKGDAAIILPGGMGTLDELFEMLTWNNLKIHDKKVFILNTNGYYDPLVHLLDNMQQEGFMYDAWRDRVNICSTPEEIINAFS